MNDFLCCAGTGSDHFYYWSCNCFQEVRCSEWSNDAHQVGSGNHGACVGPSAAFCHQTQKVHTILNNCSCCYLPIYIFTESQNYSLLIPSMLDQLFSTNSLEHVRIIFQSENSKLCWSIERSPRIESFFPLGREFVQSLWKVFFVEGICLRILKATLWGRELVQGFWKVFFWKWICLRILKAFLLGRDLSNDFDSLFSGKGIRVQELKTFLGRRKFFSWLRKPKSWI